MDFSVTVGNWEKERIFLPLPGIETRTLGLPARSLVTVPTELHGIPNDKMTPIPVAVRSKRKDC